MLTNLTYKKEILLCSILLELESQEEKRLKEVLHDQKE
jgi:hypothetical protein